MAVVRARADSAEDPKSTAGSCISLPLQCKPTQQQVCKLPYVVLTVKRSGTVRKMQGVDGQARCSSGGRPQTDKLSLCTGPCYNALVTASGLVWQAHV